MSIKLKSEYMLGLSVEARKRYETKLISSGLQSDPYAIPEPEWSRVPDSLPNFTWSDVMIYMLTTPSPYTKEAIKVNVSMCKSNE